MSRYHWSDTLEPILGEGIEAGEDIQQLGEKLGKLAEEGAAMPAVEMDGFVAGLQVLPGVVPAPEGIVALWGAGAEWIVHVWGPGTEFDNIGEGMEMEAALLGHYHVVGRTLEEEPDQYRPLLEEDMRDGGVIWKPWILGFARAMRLRPAAWARIESIDDLDVQEALQVMQRLYESAKGTSGLEPEGLDLLDEMAPMLICGMVRELSSLRQSLGSKKRREANVAEVSAPTAESQVPCSCGSGRPYRRCCGAH